MTFCLHLVRSASLAAVLAASTCFLGACAAGVEEHPDTVYVSSGTLPVNVDTYPSAVYQGRTVYLVEGRWYYRDDGGRYSYFREEPSELRDRRMNMQKKQTTETEPRRPDQSRPEQAPDGRDHASSDRR